MMGMKSPLTALISCRRLLQAVTMSVVFLAAAAAVAEKQSQPQQLLPAVITLPGCPDKCGDISIPYPFGIKPGCFLDGFQVTCNYSFQPPRLFLDTSAYHLVADLRCEETGCHIVGNTSVWPVELMDISVAQAEARAYGMVRSSCYTNGSSQIRRVQVTSLMAPFVLAPERNALTGVGKRVLVDMRGSLYTSGTMFSCLSDTGYNPEWAKNGLCAGMGCCQAVVPPALGSIRYIGVGFTSYDSNGWLSPKDPCGYGMVVEISWYNFSTEDMYGDGDFLRKFPRGVPFVIDFAIRNGSCPTAEGPPPANYACRSGNSSCASAANGEGYVCKCWEHYDGNPYIPNGCQDIDECALRDQYPELRKDYPCSSDGICVNRLGGYDCPCKHGMKGDGKAGTCTEQFPLPAKVAVGAIGVLLAMAIVVFLMILRREKRKMKEEKRKMKEYFERNGGLTLQKVNTIKIFKKEELKSILKSHNFIGNGAFGEVYKGFLDGEQVAVKVYKGLLNDQQVAVEQPNKDINEKQREQFANEVIIQSSVIHKNIVRLKGCCLEVDVPILVYEFISNGSLDDILHGVKKKPLNLDQRLSIAAESADGLAYMHSKANTTTAIIHGDVKPDNILLSKNEKPDNILLDADFTPKISDFGISRMITIDHKAQYTEDVIGHMSYMDPVYLQRGLLTQKSDVYSFGVVLLELISRKKATDSANGNLINSFLDAHNIKDKTAELFDTEITTTRDREILHGLAGIAVECLKLDVDQRPEMTDVAERLLLLKRSLEK